MAQDISPFDPKLRYQPTLPYEEMDIEEYVSLFPEKAERLGRAPFTAEFLRLRGHMYEPDFDPIDAWNDTYWFWIRCRIGWQEKRHRSTMTNGNIVYGGANTALKNCRLLGMS